MLTVVFAVLANYFFGQVTILSGFGGISGIQIHTPGVIGNPNLHPNRLYYIALVTAVVVYVLIRYLVRTPFGIALQGIRDDPMRMSSLGYNVSAHRTIAFGFAAFISAVAGVLFVWWNDHIDPGDDQPRRRDQPADRLRDRRPLQARGRLGGRARVRAHQQLPPRHQRALRRAAASTP